MNCEKSLSMTEVFVVLGKLFLVYIHASQDVTSCHNLFNGKLTLFHQVTTRHTFLQSKVYSYFIQRTDVTYVTC